ERRSSDARGDPARAGDAKRERTPPADPRASPQGGSRVTRRRQVIVLLISLPLLGCTTRLVGQREPLLRSTPAPLMGVPFQLTRPRYEIVPPAATAATGEGKYTLRVAWEAD